MMRLIVLAALVPSLAHADSAAPTTANCACPAKPATVVIDKGAAARTQAKWIAIGGAALWVGSVVWAMRIQDDFEAFAIDKAEAQRSMRYASGVFIGGVAALGVAAYLYFGKGRERALVATPVITPDRVGMALSRRF